MANTFREVYKKTGSTSYQLVGNIGVNGVKLDIMKGATSSEDGEIGLVPKATTGEQNHILTGNGHFSPIDTILKSSSLIGSQAISSIYDGTITGILKSLYDEKINIYISSNSDFNALYLINGNMLSMFFVWCNSSSEATQNHGFWRLNDKYIPKSTVNTTCCAFDSNSRINNVGLTINTVGDIYHTSSVPRIGIIAFAQYELKNAI